MSSTIYGARVPAKAHLARPKGTVGEVTKLRSDLEKIVGSGTQYLLIDVPGPAQTLTPSGLTIVANTTGAGWQAVLLPNGGDGVVKKVVNGFNGQGPGDGVYVSCHNNLGNDAYDLPYGTMVELTYVEALGGWVATNYCPNVNANWD